jgi:hypothetical protein
MSTAMDKLWRVVVPALAGLGGGIIAVQWAGPVANHDDGGTQSGRATVAASEPIDVMGDTPRFVVADGGVGMAVIAPAVPPTQASSEAESSAPLRPPPTPTEFIEMHRASVDAEPRDGRWSRDANYLILEDFSDASSSASVLDVDCRTHQCMVTLQWPDVTQAQHEAGTLASRHYGLNCTNSISLTDAPPGRPYTGYLFFDCRDSATNGIAME